MSLCQSDHIRLISQFLCNCCDCTCHSITVSCQTVFKHLNCVFVYPSAASEFSRGRIHASYKSIITYNIIKACPQFLTIGHTCCCMICNKSPCCHLTVCLHGIHRISALAKPETAYSPVDYASAAFVSIIDSSVYFLPSANAFTIFVDDKPVCVYLYDFRASRCHFVRVHIKYIIYPSYIACPTSGCYAIFTEPVIFTSDDLPCIPDRFIIDIIAITTLFPDKSLLDFRSTSLTSGC